MDVRRNLHPWEMSWEAATKLQKQLAEQIELVDQRARVDTMRFVAGVDVSHELYADDIFAAAVVVDLETGAVVETQTATYHTHFPYKTGYLSFRELPAILLALAKVKMPVDAILADGQGIAHPRGLGIASHMGLWVDVPTIGCGKHPLYGRYDEPQDEPFAKSSIASPRGEPLGYALRSKKRASPLFISPGNHIDIDSAVGVAIRCCRGYRLPEPTRQAHLAANAVRRGSVHLNEETDALP